MNNIETANLILAFEDFKNNYNKYKDDMALFPQLYLSHARFATKHSAHIIEKFRKDLSDDLLKIKSKAIELEKLGLKSQLIDKVKTM